MIPYEKNDIENALNTVVKSTCCHCGSDICVNYRIDSSNLFLCVYCQSFKCNDPLEFVKLQSGYFKDAGFFPDRVAFQQKLYGSKLYDDLKVTDFYGTKLVLPFFNRFDPANLAKISPDFINGMGECGWKLYYPFKVRFLNPDGQFDYTRTDMVFVHEDEFYVITNRPEYKKYDVNSGIFKKKKFLDYLPSCNHFIIKAMFAGIELGARDVHGEAIYTGDIIVSNTQQACGMAMFTSSFETHRAVYHARGTYPTPFEIVDDWEIRGNIILNNPHYTGCQGRDFSNYFEEHFTWFMELFK